MNFGRVISMVMRMFMRRGMHRMMRGSMRGMTGAGMNRTVAKSARGAKKKAKTRT